MANIFVRFLYNEEINCNVTFVCAIASIFFQQFFREFLTRVLGSFSIFLCSDFSYTIVTHLNSTFNKSIY